MIDSVSDLLCKPNSVLHLSQNSVTSSSTLEYLSCPEERRHCVWMDGPTSLTEDSRRRIGGSRGKRVGCPDTNLLQGSALHPKITRLPTHKDEATEPSTIAAIMRSVWEVVYEAMRSICTVWISFWQWSCVPAVGISPLFDGLILHRFPRHLCALCSSLIRNLLRDLTGASVEYS